MCEKGEGKGRKGSGKYGEPSMGKSWNVGSGVKNVKYVIISRLVVVAHMYMYYILSLPYLAFFSCLSDAAGDLVPDQRPDHNPASPEEVL